MSGALSTFLDLIMKVFEQIAIDSIEVIGLDEFTKPIDDPLGRSICLHTSQLNA